MTPVYTRPLIVVHTVPLVTVVPGSTTAIVTTPLNVSTFNVVDFSGSAFHPNEAQAR